MINKKPLIIIGLILVIGFGGFFAKNQMAKAEYNKLIETGLDHMDKEEYSQALRVFDQANDTYEKSNLASVYRAQVYFKLNHYPNTVAYALKAINLDADSHREEMNLLLTEVYLLQKKPNLAFARAKSVPKGTLIRHFNQMDISSYDADQVEDLINLHYHFTSEEQTMTFVEDLIETYPDMASLHHFKGVLFHNRGDYYHAIEHAQAAVSLDNQARYYSSLMAAYYSSHRMYACQDLAHEVLDNHYNLDEAKYFLALTHKFMGEYDQALDYALDLKKGNPNSILTGYFTKDDLTALLGELYLRLGDEEEANGYFESYKDQGSHVDQLVKDLKKQTVGEAAENDASYLADLIKTHYMFDYDLKPSHGIKGKLSDQDIDTLLQAMKDPEDPFTYVLYGDYYNYYVDNNPHYLYKQLADDVHYINFEIFTQTVHLDFIRDLDTIENSQEATLILDLRDNMGGQLIGTQHILDNLIDQGLLFTLVSERDYDEDFEANDFKKDFKAIYVLVNEGTGSASELTALSLKENLDNVTLVGQTTYGKGVGQDIIDDIINQRRYFIVNFYMMVGDINYHKTGVEPDILIDNDKIDTYMKDLLGLDDF